MTRVDDAVTEFKNGFNCAQAILSAFSQEYGLNKELALKVGLERHEAEEFVDKVKDFF